MTGALSEWITPLNMLLTVIGTIGGGALALVAWAFRQRRAISAEIRDAVGGQAVKMDEVAADLVGLERRTEGVERGVDRLNSRVDALPTASQLHELHTDVQTLIAEIKGDRALMQRIERTLDRHEQTLERLWNTK